MVIAHPFCPIQNSIYIYSIWFAVAIPVCGYCFSYFIPLFPAMACRTFVFISSYCTTFTSSGLLRELRFLLTILHQIVSLDAFPFDQKGINFHAFCSSLKKYCLIKLSLKGALYSPLRY